MDYEDEPGTMDKQRHGPHITGMENAEAPTLSFFNPNAIPFSVSEARDQPDFRDRSCYPEG